MSQPTGKCQKSVCRFKRFAYTDWIRQKPEISGTWSLTPEVRWNFFTFLHSPYFHKWQVGEWWAIMAWFKSLLIAVNKISFLKTTWPVLRNLCNKCWFPQQFIRKHFLVFFVQDIDLFQGHICFKLTFKSLTCLAETHAHFKYLHVFKNSSLKIKLLQSKCSGCKQKIGSQNQLYLWNFLVFVTGNRCSHYTQGIFFRKKITKKIFLCCPEVSDLSLCPSLHLSGFVRSITFELQTVIEEQWLILFSFFIISA